jgi:hypothetical protein
MVNGDGEMVSTLVSRSVFTSGMSLGLMMYELGRTEERRVGVDEAAPAGVSGLNPDQARSNSTVEDPPTAGTRGDATGASTWLIRWEPR